MGRRRDVRRRGAVDELIEEKRSGNFAAAKMNEALGDNLAGIAHEQRNLFSGIGQDEVADAYEEVSSKLHAAARELFPLYPHPEYTSDAVQDWLRENNFER